MRCFDFNQPVDNLPKKLTHLTFGYYFNKEVNNLPKSLTHLTFGKKFNQQADNLPNSLIHLIFYYNYKYGIKIPYGCKVFKQKNI